MLPNRIQMLSSGSQPATKKIPPIKMAMKTKICSLRLNLKKKLMQTKLSTNLAQNSWFLTQKALTPNRFSASARKVWTKLNRATIRNLPSKTASITNTANITLVPRRPRIQLSTWAYFMATRNQMHRCSFQPAGRTKKGVNRTRIRALEEVQALTTQTAVQCSTHQGVRVSITPRLCTR